MKDVRKWRNRAYVVDSVLLGVRGVFDFFVLETVVVEPRFLVAPVAWDLLDIREKARE